MGKPRRSTVSAWVMALVFVLVTASAGVVGAKDATKDSDGDSAGSKRIESLLHQVLQENRALRERLDLITAENASFRNVLQEERASFRESQLDLLEQLDEMRGILRSFDQRLSAFSDLDQRERSRLGLGNGLSDAFKPAVARPLLDPGTSRTPGAPGPTSSRDSLAQGLGLTPSNPLGVPGSTGGRQAGLNSILITPQLFRGILPRIPYLEVGYLYNFGKGVSTGRLTLNYLLPIRLASDNVVFGVARGEFTNFWDTVSSFWRQVDATPQYVTTQTKSRYSFNERTDLSFGGGYRRIFGGSTLLGVNGFYDTTRLGNRWYSSGSVGFEFAALLPGSDAVDLTFNWYRNLFRSNVLANAFRRGPSNFDFQAGYSHELWNGGPDLRLSATGYRFSASTGVYGGRAAMELSTRDGMFRLKYEAAHDRVNSTYHTVSALVNVGLDLGNLWNGGSPIVMPEPIFRSPRNLRRWLVQAPRRDPASPAAIVVTRSTSSTECVNTTILSGPFSFFVGDPFAIPVPDITGCQFTSVRISWSNIDPNPDRVNQQFFIYDGAIRYTTSPPFDMSSDSGTVTLTLGSPVANPGPTQMFSFNPLDALLSAGPAGFVLFEFF